MNTKGHPLRVAFCIYFKPVSLKKRTLSELPAPLPFFPSHDVRAILPAPAPVLPAPSCGICPRPILPPRSVHRAQKSPPHYRGTIKHGTDRGARSPPNDRNSVF